MLGRKIYGRRRVSIRKPLKAETSFKYEEVVVGYIHPGLAAHSKVWNFRAQTINSRIASGVEYTQFYLPVGGSVFDIFALRCFEYSSAAYLSRRTQGWIMDEDEGGRGAQQSMFRRPVAAGSKYGEESGLFFCTLQRQGSSQTCYILVCTG